MRLRRVKEVGERAFWNLLMFAFAWWVVALVSGPIADLLLTNSPGLVQFAMHGPYLFFYGAVAAALEIHPHVRDNPISYPLLTLDRAGSFVLLFGLLLYFLVVPGISSGETSILWSSDLALFVAFDAYFVLRLWHLRRSAATLEWQLIYTWLLIAVAIWGMGDLALALMYENIVTDPGWGTPFDLVWPISFATVAVATRPAIEQHEYQANVAISHESLGMGPLVMYALVPLLLHVALYRFGNPDPEFKAMRDVLVLGLTVILAAMTLVYQRLLRVENRRLTREEGLASEKLAHQAFHDELTGLPNRNLFRDRLRRAMTDSLRYQTKCAVLFCDLDHFKVINDSLGHEAGDQALLATARRLRVAVRKQDTVARFGGDEFAIIVQGMHQALDAVFLAEKLLATFSEPLVVGDKHHVLSASIGIAVFPDDGEEEETLLKHADTAMYQAKLHGRNTYRLFTEAMNEAAKERLATEQGLRTGLMEDRFTIFYQPIVELASGQPVAYEALLRWNHTGRDWVSPANFIDVAEQTGLIVPIGKWVLETACSWAAQLDPTGGVSPTISVNMSPRQLRDPGLAKDVKQVLKSTGLDPARLLLEITESAALSLNSTIAALNSLRNLGVRIAIDDFGTGYSSLSHLQDLPVDIVKIDGSFIKGIEANLVSEAIVLAIVNMARALDFYVVAEGIETEPELNLIRQTRCNAVQGYYLCEPLPAAELEKTLAGGDSRVSLIPGYSSEPPAE